MRNRTLLASAFIACFIHAILLFVNLGMTSPTLASSASALDVTLVSPPQSASMSPAAPSPPPSLIEPEQMKTPEPEAKPEPLPEPVPEVVPLPEPEPVAEPDPIESRTVEKPADVIEAAREIEFIGKEPSEDAFDKEAPTNTGSQAMRELTGDAAEPVAQSEYPGDSVDQMPSYVHNPKPAYPWSARRRGQQGTVLLMVEILASGRVGTVRVERSSGYELLDDAAVKAVRKWRFVPARRGTAAVKSWVKIPVEFDLRD